jgi:hypothetical protein
MTRPGAPLDVEGAVRERYGAAAREPEAALCCPIEYDPRYLEVVPREVIERDYGCGDPSRYVRPGDTVLDLGSGGGIPPRAAADLRLQPHRGARSARDERPVVRRDHRRGGVLRPRGEVLLS